MTVNYRNYNTGHPWYYKLGGPILRPKEILTAAKTSAYQGYLAEDIAAADSKAEPERSKVLRNIKGKVMAGMWQNISRYRALAGQLRQERQSGGIEQSSISCNDLHTSMSLKHNHIYNDMAHLNLLDGLLNQYELF